MLAAVALLAVACGGPEKPALQAPVLPATNVDATPPSAMPTPTSIAPAAAAIAQPAPVPRPPVATRPDPAPAGGAVAAVLFGVNERLRLPPASLVKIATAVLAIEQGDLDRPVVVDVDAWTMEVEADSSVMGLGAGDRFTLRDLLYGMLLPSGSDAAVAIARAVAGDETEFVAQLNALAARLGLTGTRFADVDGLADAGQNSTAYDLALLGRYAMSLAAFREVVSAERWVARGSRDIELLNTNPLLGYTDGVDGVKTGFTDGAGRTFVASATRNGHQVFVVLLNDPYRARDAIALIEWAFATYSWPQ